MADSTPCNVEDVSSAFVESPKYIFQTIADKIRNAKTLFTSLIPRSTYEYGHGYIQYKEEFHGGLGIQDGAASWKVMEKYRAPGTKGQADPGYDPCKSSALVVGVGTEEKSYTIYQTERRTLDICLTDAQFFWQLEQQLALWYKSLSQVSLAEWEQILSRAYEKFCTKAVVRLGSIDTATGLDTFTLTPDAGAVFGGKIAVPSGGLGTIGVLNQSILDRLYAYLVRQLDNDGFLGMADGLPLIGVAGSQEVLGNIIKQDSKEISALYWAAPQVNIEGYGKMRTYKNWVWMNDWNATRYQVSSDGKYLEPVYPYTKTPTTIGEAIAVDPRYLNAPFEVVKIIMRNVFTAQVPPPNPASISGFQFAPQDNIMEWNFKNHDDRCDNPYREKGYFLARARMAPSPEVNSAYAIEVLVRRCDVVDVVQCTNCTNTDATPTITAVEQYDDTEVASETVEWVLTLEGCLDAQVGDEVTVAWSTNGAGTANGIIIDQLGTTMIIALASAKDLSSETMTTVTLT